VISIVHFKIDQFVGMISIVLPYVLILESLIALMNLGETHVDGVRMLVLAISSLIFWLVNP
jgi:hypothetical protein